MNTLFKPKEDSGLQAALVQALSSEFPNELPEDGDGRLISSIGPSVIRAVRQLRQRRILSEAGKLPLQQFIDGIQAAIQGVRSEISKHETVEARIEELQRKVQDSDSEPLQIAQLAGEIASLRSTASTPLVTAIDALMRALDVAGASLLEISRYQSSRDQIACRLGAWAHIYRHPSVSIKSPTQRAETIIEIARQSIEHIQELQAGHVPVAPVAQHAGVRERINYLNLSFDAPPNEDETKA